MAVFLDSEVGALDYAVLLDGGISLYKRREYLEEDLNELGEAGYRTFRLDCRTWRTDLDMHHSLAEGLAFPAYYGKNLDALSDVLSDVEVPVIGGVAIVLHRYDAFAEGHGNSRTSSDRALSEVVLDIFSRASHESLLHGRRFLVMVQSDDGNLSFPKVGGRSPGWNRREWLNKDRGL